MSSFNHIAGRNINIEIDDGVLTSLSNKGDGVKSLATIAMLSQISTKKERLIIVDEPENHLHPEAIRYINSVLCNLAENNQVLISTHNPIFVNRNNISSNIIVDSGQTHKADRIDAIRETLGVISSDNLIYSDYVVVVEGPTDRDFLVKLFSEDETLKKYMNNNILTIRSVGGTNNIKSEVYSLQRYCCNYIIILDYDDAGKNIANTIKTKLSVPNDKIRYFIKNNKRETELEDLYKPDTYKDYLLSKNIDITNDKFKDKTKKWSNRISYIVAELGIDFTEEAESQYKEEIVSLIKKPVKNYLTDEGYKLSQAICDKIKDDIDKMAIY